MDRSVNIIATESHDPRRSFKNNNQIHCISLYSYIQDEFIPAPDNTYVLVPLSKLQEAERFSQGIQFLFQNKNTTSYPEIMRDMVGTVNSPPYDIKNRYETSTPLSTAIRSEIGSSLDVLNPSFQELPLNKEQLSSPFYPPESPELVCNKLSHPPEQDEQNKLVPYLTPPPSNPTSYDRSHMIFSQNHLTQSSPSTPSKAPQHLMSVEELGEQLVGYGSFAKKTRRWVYDKYPSYIEWILRRLSYSRNKSIRFFIVYIHKRMLADKHMIRGRENELVSFGKYRGRTHEWVYENAQRYCNWLLQLKCPRKQETRELIQYIRAKHRLNWADHRNTSVRIPSHSQRISFH